MQGSERLWGAASYAVTAIAKQRGWRFSKCSHRLNAMRRLAEEYNEPLLTAGYALALTFHANFYHDTMEDDAVDDGRQIVHGFVHRIVGMVEGSGP